MSNYRQQSYVIPYSGGVPAGGPGNTLSDNFDNSRPAFELVPGSGVAVPGYAALESRWQRFDTGNVFLRVAAVDTRLQMAVLEASGKGVCGIFQQLPLPAAEGETLDLVIYAQSRVSALYAQPESDAPLGPSLAGIFLADDLVLEPNTSGFLLLGTQAQSETGSGTATLTRSASASQFVAFDALPTAITESPQELAYQRIRLRQQLDNGLWTSTIALEAGSWGSDWLPMAFVEYAAAEFPLKSCGIAVWANKDTVCQVQVDNFIVNNEDFGPGYSGVMGGVQQLGAV